MGLMAKARFASKVTVIMEDGTSFDSGTVGGAFYFPYQGWEREKMDEKFRWLGRYVIDELIDMVLHFDDVSNVSQLTGLLQG